MKAKTKSEGTGVKSEISGYTRKKLKSEYEWITQQIDDIGGFGTKDLLYRAMLEREIKRRGMKLRYVVVG